MSEVVESRPDDLPVVVEQRSTPQGRSWLPKLPALLDAAVERWELELGEPFRNGSAAWVAPVRRRGDGPTCVLKITLPHREAKYEGAGPRVWNGAGAVRLLEENADDFALVVERCRPGTQLRDDRMPTKERLITAAELLARLWRQPAPDGSPFETVEAVCGEWAVLVRQRMDELRPDLDPGLVEVGARLLDELPATATRSVLIHGDFNPTNILRAERERWLAMDAKPMIGDLATTRLRWSSRLVLKPTMLQSENQLRHDFELFAAVVGEPVDRLLAWATAREVESALWNVFHDRPTTAKTNMVRVRAFAGLSGL